MKSTRTAVIGVGHQGRWHAEKFAALGESELVAVTDIDEGRRQEVADKLGVSAVADFRDLIGEVDAVSIATPTPSHFEIVGELLEHGIHVLVEKPITENLEQARSLVESAESRGLVL